MGSIISILGMNRTESQKDVYANDKYTALPAYKCKEGMKAGVEHFAHEHPIYGASYERTSGFADGCPLYVRTGDDGKLLTGTALESACADWAKHNTTTSSTDNGGINTTDTTAYNAYQEEVIANKTKLSFADWSKTPAGIAIITEGQGIINRIFGITTPTTTTKTTASNTTAGNDGKLPTPKDGLKIFNIPVVTFALVAVGGIAAIITVVILISSSVKKSAAAKLTTA